MADQEEIRFRQEVEEVKRWWKSSRFDIVHRPYTAEQIVSKRGEFPTVYRSDFLAKKLWATLQENKRTGKTSHTFGCLDPVQVCKIKSI